MTETVPVWLYALSLNEMRMLEWFFRHYDPWVDRYIFYDDGSTDGTIEFLRARANVEVRRFERTDRASFVASATNWQNTVWKESRGLAGWVVVTAVDEHIFHPAMPAYLRDCRSAGVTAIPALGFHMVSETVPAQTETLARTRRNGATTWEMNKLSIFDPSALIETNYSPGRHFAEPVGRVRYPEVDAVLNLHYKFIDKAYLAARHQELYRGLRADDVAQGFGAHYDRSEAEFEQIWQRAVAGAIDYTDPSVGFSTHIQRWWRGPRQRG